MFFSRHLRFSLKGRRKILSPFAPLSSETETETSYFGVQMGWWKRCSCCCTPQSSPARATADLVLLFARAPRFLPQFFGQYPAHTLLSTVIDRSTIHIFATIGCVHHNSYALTCPAHNTVTFIAQKVESYIGMGMSNDNMFLKIHLVPNKSNKYEGFSNTIHTFRIQNHHN